MPAQFPKPGPEGPAGGVYMTEVTEPSDNIVISHNLNRAVVNVMTYDVDGNAVFVGVNVQDVNTIVLTTVPELPFSGTVVVN